MVTQKTKKIAEIRFFSCNSSSISNNVGLSVCLSLGPQRVLQKCYAVGSVYMLLVLLQFRLLDHSVVIYCNFSCDSSSISHNVSRSVCLSAPTFMEVLCCYQRIIVVSVVVVLCIREKYFIIFQPEGASLNSRSELFTTCRHRKKQLLANTQKLVQFSFWYRIVM